VNSTARLMKNTLLLTGGSVLLRAVGLCFQAYLARNVGAELLGIFGLVSSVYIVFSTISISGVRFSVTRLAAEEIGRGNEYPLRLMKSAFLYALIFGMFSAFSMYFTSYALASFWIGNGGAALPLRIMAFAMPFIAFGGVFDGYFTAKQKVFRLVFAQVINQAARIGVIVYAFKFIDGAKNHPCDVLATGALFGETAYTALLIILYFVDVHRKKTTKKEEPALKRLMQTAMPLAVSAYMRTGLSSLGHVIIPRGLKKSGMAASGAFVTYGIIHQMAFPVIMFPAALLSALGEVLIPRLTYAQVNGRKIGISYIVNRALRIGIIFSFMVTGVMFFYADVLGNAVYKNSDAAFYIRLLAPLVPVIYIDSVTDGCLKGLGQQLYSMRLNVMEGVINIVLLLLLLPEYAIKGYILTIYIKEIFNTSLSLRRLGKVTSVDITLPTVFCMLAASLSAKFLTGIVAGNTSVLAIVFYVLFYGVILYVTNSLSRDDIKWIFASALTK